MSSTISSNGFNLIGYATSPMGLGEDLRTFAAMLDHLGIAFSVIDVPTDVSGRVHVAWQHMTTQSYRTSIFFMSAMAYQNLATHHPYLFKPDTRRIGYFLWELPDFPDAFVPALQYVDQIWCPTRFVQKTFFDKSRKVTLVLPLPVVQHPATGRNFRKELNIPSDAFVSLYMFDLHSTLTRKNPHAVLRVFLEFAQHNPKAYLVLKVNRWQNMGPNALSWIPTHDRIKVLKDTLNHGELTDLYQNSDCYLSLHCSEGFGRTLVEALQNGLHVVSTDFSGPQDFLTPQNALLVKWQPTEVGPDDYPNLNQISWWAKPDEPHAVAQLKKAQTRAKKGRNTIGQLDGQAFGYEALAQKYRPIFKTYIRS